jgi:hypothetical protein
VELLAAFSSCKIDEEFLAQTFLSLVVAAAATTT